MNAVLKLFCDLQCGRIAFIAEGDLDESEFFFTS